MKKLNLLLGMTLLVASGSMYAQDSTKVLFHIPKPNISTIGIYIAPEYQYGQLKNKFTSLGGFSGMVLFNSKFGIGGTMERSLDRSFSPSGISPLYLHTSVGGLKLEYVIMPQSVVHFAVNLTIGGGMARADSSSSFRNYYDRSDRMDFGDHNIDRHDRMNETGIQSNFFITQPGAQIEANLFKYVKLFAGVNYRFAIQGNRSNALIPTSTMQGLSASVGLKIGLFEHVCFKAK